MRRLSLARLLTVLVLVAPPIAGRATAQTPLIDDDRTYSMRETDRGYVSARCAALFLRVSDIMRESDSATAQRLGTKAPRIQRRVPAVRDEKTFLDWASRYGAMLERAERENENPATSVWGKDYKVCDMILVLMQNGEEVDRYSRAELRFLFGG